MPSNSNDIEAINKSTTNLIKSYQEFISSFVSKKGLDYITLTQHANKRGEERDITVQQIKFMLRHNCNITDIIATTGTRTQNIYKLRINGSDFDNKNLTVICIPEPQLIKIITTYYPENITAENG